MPAPRIGGRLASAQSSSVARRWTPSGAVLGREQRLGELDRRPVGVAEDRRDLLVAVARRTRRAQRRQRQQAAVGEDDPDRPPQCRVVAPRARFALPRPARLPPRRDRAKIRSADPRPDAAACAAIYAPHVEGSRDLFEERPPDAAELAARIERLGRTHPWLVAERDGESSPASPTPAGTARGPPTAGRSTSRSTSPIAAAARDSGRRALRSALREPRVAGLPGRLRRDHPAQRGERGPPRAPRLRAGRRLPRDRLEGRRLARRRLVAARAGAGRRGDTAEPAEPAEPTPLPWPCPRTRLPDRESPRTTSRGARGGHRPRAGPRLRLARPRLRRRDREAGRLRHLHPDHPGLPDRPPGLRADEGVRRRPRGRLRRPPEDGLRPALVARR